MKNYGNKISILMFFQAYIGTQMSAIPIVTEAKNLTPC